VEANDVGDVFPIWGTCMGFQFLSILTARTDSILCEHCYDSHTPLPLDFVEPVATTSRLYSGLSAELKQKLATEKLTANAHHDGIRPSTFQSNPRLASFYDVLSTNVVNGSAFVSSIEAKAYPFAATQWHPEKNSFEWTTLNGEGAIPHGADATAVAQYMADFVVGQARRSAHAFPSESEEAAALIYNYPAVPGPEGYFAQVYLFQRPPLPP
jgi:gamma-glutamyl hydrolase